MSTGGSSPAHPGFTPRPGSGGVVSGSARLPRNGQWVGPYQVLGQLGSGGMGAVLSVRDAAGRELALKLLGRADPSPQAMERFRREGQLTAALRHPGIARVHEAGPPPTRTDPGTDPLG